MQERQAISYKDSMGFVLKKSDGFYRYIAYEYKQEYDCLMQSGLYQFLVDNCLMISHEEIKIDAADKRFYKIIFPEQIDFISYPFEWSFSQWKKMLLTYITINQAALKYGMILKDATPYNFSFYNGNCVLIDTSSFNLFEEGKPWMAYRQFCEEILGPFTLMYYKDPMWAKLYGNSITGLPLSFVSRQLPLKSYFNSCTLLHIHAHAFFQKSYSNNEKATATKSGFTKKKIVALLEMVKKNMHQWQQPFLKESIWDNYYEKDIETAIYLDDKIQTVTNWLNSINPATTIDIGANTGMFSFLAAQYSGNVIAVESDRLCVDMIYNNCLNKNISNILPVVADIAEPSAGLGWNNKEKIALLKRLKGDMLLALAVIHHLCISRNVPMDFVAKLFADITASHAIIEFVPKTDVKTKILLQHRADIFSSYSEDAFIICFEQYFTLIKTHSFKASGRKLFLWQKK